MMSENMNLSINGQTQIPPGFRFHPTEEELLHYYLRKKVTYEKIDLDVIREVDLNKLEPWDIQERCRIGTAPQNDWYFFSHKDKKYPTGTRTNRATAAGFWKATGRDKIIYSGSRRIGLRKTLVFYKGRAPHGQKSDWIMHEYRLDDSTNDDSSALNSNGDSNTPEEGWVVCRVFKKKNYQKTLDVPKSSIDPSKMHQALINSNTNDDVLDQILLYMGRSCNNKMEHNNHHHEDHHHAQNTTTNTNKVHNADSIKNETLHHMSFNPALCERFLHLPRLDSPINSMIPNNMCTDTPYDHDCRVTNYSNHDQQEDQSFDEMMMESEPSNTNNNNSRINQLGDGCGPTSDPRAGINDWAALDRLVASQLNGQNPVFGLFPDDDTTQNRPNPSNLQIDCSSGNGYWSSSSASSSDPLRHLLV